MLERLRKRRDFLCAASSGNKWVAPGLILQVRPNDRGDGSADGAMQTGSIRVGFTVSRKVGGAVARNRARRRLRAVAELVLPKQARPGRDYVLIGRSATLTRPFPALVRDLETGLRRLKASREDVAPAIGRRDADGKRGARRLRNVR